MLQWDIEIRYEFFQLFHLLDLIQRYDVWIQVEESIHEISWNPIQPFEEGEQCGFAESIESVSRRILSDQDDFFDSVLDHIFGFFDDVRDGPGT